MTDTSTQPQSEAATIARYAAGAQQREEALCCPVDYDTSKLKVLPDAILERDYGCGDPSRYVRPGDTVLDLGSGAGKICWIASQIVGESGRVLGVDMNTEMLALAAEHHAGIAEKIGYDNVTFHRGMIQDLALDLAKLDQRLKGRPVDGLENWLELRQAEDQLRREPMIADESVDIVLSNCVLNLVRSQDKGQLFREIFRVTKPDGRIAISDIVSDEDIPQHLADDPELWSGCISGALREDHFVQAFLDAGFVGVTVEKRDELPWRTVEGLEFRSVTVTAIKPDTGAKLDRNQAVVYKGPFRKVEDDQGRTYERGVRTAVSSRDAATLARGAYAEQFFAVSPYTEVPEADAKTFCKSPGTLRDAKVTKAGEAPKATGGSCC